MGVFFVDKSDSAPNFDRSAAWQWSSCVIVVRVELCPELHLSCIAAEVGEPADFIFQNIRWSVLRVA